MMENPPPPSPLDQSANTQGEKNKLGFAGFILSLVSFLTCGLLSPVSLIMSGIALRKNPQGFAIAGLAISCVSFLLALATLPMLAIAIPSFVRAREISRQNACIENLSKIDGAKQQWAIENAKEGGAVPTWDDLVGDEKYMRRIPTCPGAGTYGIESVENIPTCTLNHGGFAHVLPGPALSGHDNLQQETQAGTDAAAPQAMEVRQQNTCLENLVKIDGAKQQWALEYNKEQHAVPNWSDLIGNDKYIRSMPGCPADGNYTIGTVSEYPTCSHSVGDFPHVLPEW